jgi:hypothetical protein
MVFMDVVPLSPEHGGLGATLWDIFQPFPFHLSKI